MEQFLFTYTIEGELIKELATADRIANVIGCRDINESSDFRVYRVLRDGIYKLDARDYHKYLCVEIVDRYGNLIASGNYLDH